MIRINQLQPGQRFVVANLGISGRLIYANESRARVRIDGSTRDVRFEDSEGVARSFVARGGRDTDWAPSTEVEVEEKYTMLSKESIIILRDAMSILNDVAEEVEEWKGPFCEGDFVKAMSLIGTVITEAEQERKR